MSRLFALVCLILPLPLPLLAEEKAIKPAADAGMAGQLAQMLLGLVMVIGLIFLLAWLVRRVQQQAGMRGNGVIRLLSSQALGPRERLVLVQVGSEQILLGLTPGEISALHVLKEPVHLLESQPASPEFAQRLMEMLGKDNHKDSR